MRIQAVLDLSERKETGTSFPLLNLIYWEPRVTRTTERPPSAAFAAPTFFSMLVDHMKVPTRKDGNRGKVTVGTAAVGARPDCECVTKDLQPASHPQDCPESGIVIFLFAQEETESRRG